MLWYCVQVMVFVHARNATVRTATALRDLASSRGELPHFQPEQTSHLGLAEKQVRTLLPSLPPLSSSPLFLLLTFFLTFTSLRLSLLCPHTPINISLPLSTSSFLSSLHFSPITLSFPPSSHPSSPSPFLPFSLSLSPFLLLPFSLLSSPFSLLSTSRCQSLVTNHFETSSTMVSASTMPAC